VLSRSESRRSSAMALRAALRVFRNQTVRRPIEDDQLGSSPIAVRLDRCAKESAERRARSHDRARSEPTVNLHVQLPVQVLERSRVVVT
jgi:hypothetical protein